MASNETRHKKFLIFSVKGRNSHFKIMVDTLLLSLTSLNEKRQEKE